MSPKNREICTLAAAFVLMCLVVQGAHAQDPFESPAESVQGHRELGEDAGGKNLGSGGRSRGR